MKLIPVLRICSESEKAEIILVNPDQIVCLYTASHYNIKSGEIHDVATMKMANGDIYELSGYDIEEMKNYIEQAQEDNDDYQT